MPTQTQTYVAQLHQSQSASVPPALRDDKNAKEIIASASQYFIDTLSRVRAKMYSLVSDVGSGSKDQTVRQQAVGNLIDATHDLENLDLLLSELSGFSKSDFTSSSKDTLVSLFRRKPPYLDQLARLVGTLQINELKEDLRVLSGPSTTNQRIRWSALVALARMGDSEALQSMMRRAQRLPVNDDVVYEVFPDLVHSLLQHTIDLPFGKKTPFNSFLSPDGVLFALAIDGDFLGLSIFDSSLTRLKDLRYVKEKPVDFKRTDLIKDGENLDRQWRGKWDDDQIAKYELKVLNAGLPVVAVGGGGASFRLLVGSSKPNSTGGSIPMGFGVNGAPLGYAWLNSTDQYNWKGYNSDYASRAHFYGQLNKDFEPSQEETRLGTLYRIAQRLSELRKLIKINDYGIINSEKATYFVYLNKKERKLNIEEFK